MVRQESNSLKQGYKIISTEQEEGACPLTCQESSHSGSNKNCVTGNSAEAFDDDEVPQEGYKSEIMIYESQRYSRLSQAQGGVVAATSIMTNHQAHVMPSTSMRQFIPQEEEKRGVFMDTSPIVS